MSKSILGRAAVEAGKEKPARPWWEDAEKLLGRVLALAERDPSLRDRLRAKLGVLARGNDEFRLDLQKDLQALGKGKRGHPNEYGPLAAEYVFAMVKWCRDEGLAKNNDEAFEWCADRLQEDRAFSGITGGGVRGLYERCRRKNKPPM